MVASPPRSPRAAGVSIAPGLTCPRCSGEDIHRLSSQQMLLPMAKDQPHLLRVTISTYKCACGIGFTHTTTCEEPRHACSE